MTISFNTFAKIEKVAVRAQNFLLERRVVMAARVQQAQSSKTQSPKTPVRKSLLTTSILKWTWQRRKTPGCPMF